MAFAAPQKVFTEVSTAAPSGRCRERRASSMATVHEDTATACSAPTWAANSDSKAATSAPVVTHPEASTRSAAWRAAGEMKQSANGTCWAGRVSGTTPSPAR